MMTETVVMIGVAGLSTEPAPVRRLHGVLSNPPDVTIATSAMK
jgi:hypothetical protein